MEWPCPSARLFTTHFYMALLPLRPRTQLIWGILRNPRWPPRKFELTLYPIQHIACERDRLQTACRIDFVF